MTDVNGVQEACTILLMSMTSYSVPIGTIDRRSRRGRVDPQNSKQRTAVDGDRDLSSSQIYMDENQLHRVEKYAPTRAQWAPRTGYTNMQTGEESTYQGAIPRAPPEAR